VRHAPRARRQVLASSPRCSRATQPQLQHAALRLTARGWGDGAAAGARRLRGAGSSRWIFEATRPWPEHSGGRGRTASRSPPSRAVGEVTRDVLEAVRDLGGPVEIDPAPQEVPWSVPPTRTASTRATTATGRGVYAAGRSAPRSVAAFARLRSGPDSAPVVSGGRVGAPPPWTLLRRRVDLDRTSRSRTACGTSRVTRGRPPGRGGERDAVRRPPLCSATASWLSKIQRGRPAPRRRRAPAAAPAPGPRRSGGSAACCSAAGVARAPRPKLAQDRRVRVERVRTSRSTPRTTASPAMRRT